jgi:serine/threonine-protein kinase
MAVVLDPRIGSVLAGYRIEALLGRGGMGVVYLAQDLSLERRVALKLLAPELSADAIFRDRFLRESRLAASIDHPNVIPIYEAGETDGTLFIAMRYVEGTDLRRLLGGEGLLEPARTIALLSQVAEALDVAHDHCLVHRDVKPANVLIAGQSGREHVYLADFGLSRQLAAPGAIERSHFAGSADYVAPEQVQRNPLDGRADLYALACVLHHCLTGQPPFRRESMIGTLFAHVNDDPPSASQVNPDLPKEIDPVLRRALAKEPEQRQQTCRDLIDEAREALGIAPRTGWRHLTRRTKLALALIALAIAAAAAVPALLLTGGGTSATSKPDTSPTLAITADSVQHIDPTTNELVSTSRIGRGSTDTLATGEISAVAAGQGAVWVTNEQTGTLSRISPQTGEVTGETGTSGDDTGGHPVDVATGYGSVWVVNNGNGNVTVVDPTTLGLVLPYNVTSNTPWVASWIAVDQSVWVVAVDCEASCPGEGLLWFSDGSGNGSIPFPPMYVTEAAAADGTLWLSGYLDVGSRSGQLMSIDEASRRYLDSTPLDFLPAGGLAAGDGDVWIADPLGDRLVRIHAATRQVVARVPVGHNPTAVATGFGAVWVTNYDDGTVSRIDAATNEVVATIEVGPHPDHIAAGEGGVWVAVHAV